MIHVSPKHRVVCVPAEEALKNIFPGAQLLTMPGSGGHIVLPHVVDVTRLLRNMGHDVPAPVLSQYSWPHPPGKPPFEVQRKTCALMTMNERAYVLNGMGTGKTKAALWSFDYLRSVKHATKMLVVAPLSTLDFVWAAEVFETVSHLKAVVLHHATRVGRLKRLEQDADIYIINHDGVKTMLKELEARTDIDTVLIDEISAYRNASTDKSKVMSKFVATKRWAWGMTGSPTPGEPTDVYGQAKIITPSRVPKYMGRFRDQLMIKVNNFKWVPKPDATQKAFEALQPAVRYTLDDVVELPPVIERMVDVPLGKRQSKIYADMEKHSYALVQSGDVTAVNAGALVNKLLQISSGYVYDSQRNVVPLDNQDRLTRLVDDINACEQKCLVFVPFVHTLEGVVAHLKSAGISCAAVHGGTSASDRSAIFNQFQNTTKYKVIVAHPQCMSHGLTLTAATLVIWFAPIASLEIFDQANARIRRVGQKFKQLILMYAATKVERKMYAILRRRQDVQRTILSLFEENTE